ncbi:MAG: hypothetical protein E7158_05365 [Firmicutes bacterium]|nr:hypothetical protein [Bacillota bacterium]
MNRIIVDVLNKIEDKGYIAYVVGGYVRDYLLSKHSYDIDICTNAKTGTLEKIFNIKSDNKYGSIKFKLDKYSFEITTFRKEIKYENGKLLEIEYTDNFKEDIKRRDFTINSIALDKNDIVIDLLEGVKDLNNKVIKLIGDESKLMEDPLRIIRAIRFSTILDFDLDEKLEKYIVKCKKYLSNVSIVKLREELEKILESTNYKKGLCLLKKYSLIDELGIKYNNVVYVDNIYGMWAQIDIKTYSSFNKKEIEIINAIKKIIRKNEITNETLFDYSIDLNIIAAKILKIDEQIVKKMYNNLVVKSTDDLDISILEINSVIKNFNKSKIVRYKLIRMVNNSILNNVKKDLLKHVEEESE